MCLQLCENTLGQWQVLRNVHVATTACDRSVGVHVVVVQSTCRTPRLTTQETVPVDQLGSVLVVPEVRAARTAHVVHVASHDCVRMRRVAFRLFVATAAAPTRAYTVHLDGVLVEWRWGSWVDVRRHHGAVGWSTTVRARVLVYVGGETRLGDVCHFALGRGLFDLIYLILDLSITHIFQFL
jgi:hypothetical protein